MPGFSLNSLRPLQNNAIAANQNTGDKIAAVGNDPDAGALTDLQAATAESRIETDLAATVTQQFTKTTGSIIDKMV